MPAQATQIQKKICLLGDFGVGKTSLINRFVYNRFDDRYLSTIGVKISRKEMHLPTFTMNLLIWDLAGNEDISELSGNYLRGAAGALIVCDLTRYTTLAIARHYAVSVQALYPRAPIFLLGNKVDLINQCEISQADLNAAAQALSLPVFLTSALTGEKVERVFRDLTTILAKDLNPQ